MKTIKLPKSFKVEAGDTGWVKLDLEGMQSSFKLIGQNKLTIIEAAYDIESQLERIIAFFFFGNNVSEEKKQDFSSQILSSSWCSFASKQGLILFIIDRTKALEGKTKSEYQKLLKKVMSCRNKFTHGELTIVGSTKEMKLSYYEGSYKIDDLTDEYFADIEVTFTRCFELTRNIAFKTGSSTKVSSLDHPLTPGQGFGFLYLKEDKDEGNKVD